MQRHPLKDSQKQAKFKISVIKKEDAIVSSQGPVNDGITITVLIEKNVISMKVSMNLRGKIIAVMQIYGSPSIIERVGIYFILKLDIAVHRIRKPGTQKKSKWSVLVQFATKHHFANMAK